MDITPLIPQEKKVISGYDDYGFSINGEKFTGNIILQASLATHWKVSNTQQLSFADFLCLPHQETLTTLLIGCGASHLNLDPLLRTKLRERGYIADQMSSPAACRTYNVLLAEARDVIAALVTISPLK
jgi:uncharacterized protein